jgi:nucleoside-triphosphatase
MKLLVTGRPGVGKTTLVRRVLEKLQQKAEGFYTGEIRDGTTGKRRGFSITTTGGESAVFADRAFDTPFRVGGYRVDVERFEALALPAVRRGMEAEEGILVIDEIGKMELCSETFAELIKEIAETRGLTLLATVPMQDVHPALKALKAADDAVVVEITAANRDAMPDELLGMLGRR